MHDLFCYYLPVTLPNNELHVFADSAHKPLPRYNKKREGPPSAPKNEPYRKNVPAQRGRGQVDRRPRARGSSGYAMGGMENTGYDNTYYLLTYHRSLLLTCCIPIIKGLVIE